MCSSRSADTALDLVYQMGQSMDLSGTRPRAGCVIRQRPHARCSVCPPLPLFPQVPDWHWPCPDSAQESSTVLNPGPQDAQRLVKALLELGVNTTASFSGDSGRTVASLSPQRPGFQSTFFRCRAGTLRTVWRVDQCASRILTASTTPYGPLPCDAILEYLAVES